MLIIMQSEENVNNRGRRWPGSACKKYASQLLMYSGHIDSKSALIPVKHSCPCNKTNTTLESYSRAIVAIVAIVAVVKPLGLRSAVFSHHFFLFE